MKKETKEVLMIIAVLVLLIFSVINLIVYTQDNVNKCINNGVDKNICYELYE